MKNLEKATKAQIIELMTEAGMAFSQELTKKQLIALYNAQAESVEVESAVANEAATEDVEVLEDTTEVADETPAEDANPSETDETPAEGETEEKPNKRRTGKEVHWYVDGKLENVFPSIKAAAQFFKDRDGLKHMPFTPIMKSVRQDIDWNENSFRIPQTDSAAAQVTTPAAPTTSEEIKEVDEVLDESLEEATEAK